MQGAGNVLRSWFKGEPKEIEEEKLSWATMRWKPGLRCGTGKAVDRLAVTWVSVCEIRKQMT